MPMSRLSDSELFLAQRFFSLKEKLGRTPFKQELSLSVEGLNLIRKGFCSYSNFSECMEKNRVLVQNQLKNKQWLLQPSSVMTSQNLNRQTEKRPLYS